MYKRQEQYYEKVCYCGCVNNCEAPNCRIKYGDNLRALVTYLNVCLLYTSPAPAEILLKYQLRILSQNTGFLYLELSHIQVNVKVPGIGNL